MLALTLRKVSDVKFTWSILKTNRGGILLRSSEFLYLLFFVSLEGGGGEEGGVRRGVSPIMKMPCLKMSPQRQRFVFSLHCGLSVYPHFVGRLLFIYAVYCLLSLNIHPRWHKFFLIMRSAVHKRKSFDVRCDFFLLLPV